MIRPYQSTLLKDGSVSYYFKPKDDPDEKRSGPYYPRGSVCWPMLNEISGVSEGYVICAAQHLQTGIIVIFAQTAFKCVDHIVDDSGKILHQGISSWFNECYARYLCDTYYRSGYDETHRQYLIQVIRSEMIKPTPCFPEVPLQNYDDAMNVLFSWRTQQKIVMDADSQLHADLLTWENTGRKRKMASVEAMITLVNGYEKFRFEKRREE